MASEVKKVAQAFGQGAVIELDADTLTIKVDISKKAREAAQPSKSGKNKLIANSGGWQNIPTTDMKMNLGLMFK